jgi:hypothetical protein
MSAQGATTIMRIDGHCLLPWPERGLVQPSVPNRFRRFAPTGPLCEEEAKYLAAAPEPLAYIATVLADTGMRPEELLPAPMGIRHVGQRSPRFAICDSRENSGCTSLATDDSKGQGGHSSIAISARYVHPSEDAVLTAMSRLPGRNSGHTEEMQSDAQPSGAKRLRVEGKNGAP